MIMEKLVALKLGESMKTDENQPYTIKSDKLGQMAYDIKSTLSRSQNFQRDLGNSIGTFAKYAEKESAPLCLLQHPELIWGRWTQSGRDFLRFGSAYHNLIAPGTAAITGMNVGSQSTDATGGLRSKVVDMLKMPFGGSYLVGGSSVTNTSKIWMEIHCN
jgi:isopentenyl phosphate kinase